MGTVTAMIDPGLMKKTELLAPAGDMDCLKAALNAGADAVYLAGPRFGARAYARNFTEEELPEAIRTAHLFGTAVYITANVLTKDRELSETVSFVKRLQEQGLDGVIVQDIGLLSVLHRECPDLPLHASTQMSISSPEGIRYLKQFGIRRVVPARELSLEEIRVLKKEGVEIEAFIHGAMCYSYSGRCLMSSFLGGRSGNRGRCAGTCRLPFEIVNRPEAGREAKETYPLSMRDLSVLSILPDLLDAGIDAFKVEGRMKSPEYVAGVISVYRKYIDRYAEWVQSGRKEQWSVEKEDRDLLENLYIRTDLSTGYYMGRDTRKLVTLSKPGYRKTPEAVIDRLKKELTGGLRQIGVDALLTLETGKEASLFLMCGKEEDLHSVQVEGSIVQAAKNRPLSEDDIRSKMEKTGGTPFYFRSLTIRSDEGIFMSLQSLGELRRNGFEKLLNDFSGPLASRRPDPEKDAGRLQEAGQTGSGAGEEAGRSGGFGESARPGGVFAQVMTEEQFEAAAESGIDGIILELEGKIGRKWLKGSLSSGACAKKLVLALPQIMRGPESANIRMAVRHAAGQHFSGIMVRTPDELQLVLEERRALREGCADQGGPCAFPALLADHSLYAWNGESVRIFLQDCGIISYPFELNGASMKDLSEGSGPENFMMTVYGRIPLMVTAGCVRQTAYGCRKEEGFLYLADRRGAHFPVYTACGSGTCCHNIVFNSVPLSLENYLEEEPVRGAGIRRLTFTDETGNETEAVLEAFLGRPAGGSHKELSGTGKQETSAIGDYTTGHYRKGAI